MTAVEGLIERVEAAGGVLTVHGERIRCRLPEEASPLIEELRARREEVLLALSQRSPIPPMPRGLRLVRWNLKDTPVRLDCCSVVTDTARFAETTVEQLRIALGDPNRCVGWSVAQLIERLDRVGVSLVLEKEAKP
jgi:hypothetical protein